MWAPAAGGDEPGGSELHGRRRRSRHLFDGMVPDRDGPRIKRPAVEGDVDRLSALPDDLLTHVLSFLPSCEAVRTCVLAHRWRHQWKGVRSLRATDDKGYESANDLNKFINYLLVLRNQLVLLEVVDIKSYFLGDFDLDEACRYINVWIRHTLEHGVQKLRVCISSDEILEYEGNIFKWPLSNTAMTSQSLVKLELIRVRLKDHFLDFSRCPAFKDLKVEFSELSSNKIVSPSLKRLNFTYCDFELDTRTRISTPSLTSLELVDCKGRTPSLESMPLLVSAFVRLRNCCDFCANSYEIGGCGNELCEGCTGNIRNNISVLLQGLSSCAHLELTAEPTVFIFRKDLTCCPVFSKLKSLLLNDWCITTSLDPLICFIQHSPTLEKLTLQLPEIHENLVNMGVSYGGKKQPIVSKHLTVEVKCHERYVLVPKILEVLGSCGIPPEQIKILPPAQQIRSRCKDPWPAGSLSFEQKRT